MDELHALIDLICIICFLPVQPNKAFDHQLMALAAASGSSCEGGSVVADVLPFQVEEAHVDA